MVTAENGMVTRVIEPICCKISKEDETMGLPTVTPVCQGKSQVTSTTVCVPWNKDPTSQLP